MKYLNRGGISNTLISLLAGNRSAAGIAVEDRIGTVLHGKKVGKVFHTEELSFRLRRTGDDEFQRDSAREFPDRYFRIERAPALPKLQ